MKLTLTHALAAVLLMLNIATPVTAGPFDDAVAAYDNGDYATAMRLLGPLADQGNADAMTLIGLMYLNDQGVPPSFTAPQREFMAGSFFGLPAKQGNASAQYGLGLIYDFGRATPQNYAEAAKWFRLAADQGNALAQSKLGYYYLNGQGVPQDYVSAYMWFNLSAASGDKDAVKARDSVAELMTPAQIAEAQKLAREWPPTIPPR
jgi:uncharacterized protein